MITMAYPIRRSRVISSGVSWIWSSGLYADPTPSSSSKFFNLIIIMSKIQALTSSREVKVVRYIDLDHRFTDWKNKSHHRHPLFAIFSVCYFEVWLGKGPFKNNVSDNCVKNAPKKGLHVWILEIFENDQNVV